MYYRSPKAEIMGENKVTIGEKSSIWPHATIRSDLDEITIGSYTNIQDSVTIHADKGDPTEIGDYVTVGHNAVVHCRSIGDNSVIGMGSQILDNVVIPKNVIIGAGSVVLESLELEEKKVYAGNPARYIRDYKDGEIEKNIRDAKLYVSLAERGELEVVE